MSAKTVALGKLSAKERELVALVRAKPEMLERLIVALQPVELRKPVLCAAEAQELLYPEVVGCQYERLVLLPLDAKGRAICRPVTLTVGHEGATIVDCRQILAECLRLRARSFILCHNHPSGDPTPSTEDRVATRRVSEAARMLGIQFHDHIILVDSGRSHSMRASGEME